MYPQDLVESILQHADIVDIISSYLNVIKKGKEYKAVCPFHADTNPSMMISKEKQIFKCFACGEGGNAITFVRKYEKISFDEAVRKVAELSGFHDPRLLKEIKVIKTDPSLEPIYNAINDLQKYYVYGLSIPEAENARKYLESRHLTSDDIVKYGIGFSPIDGESTVKFLQAKGHSLKAIEGTGIALAGTHSRDCNAGRVTFPLFDSNGQVVGFSARRFVEDDTGKYINSSDGPIFHKSKVLYNYHRAKDAARRAGHVYVTEGFMDVIALDKAGIPNAIAIMGTALTSDHLTMLKRLNCELRLCLDGDGPGQTAMMKVIGSIKKAGLNFRIVSNPGDLRDPDEILQDEGPNKLVEMMNNLVDPFQFQLSYYLNTKKLETLEERKLVLSYFIPLIKDVKDNIEKDDYVAKLARATGFETSTIYRELSRNNSSKETIQGICQIVRSTPTATSKRSRYDRLFNAEQHILYYMLKEVDAVKFFESNINSFYNNQLEAIANYILDYSLQKNEVPPVQILMGNIEASEEEDGDKLNDIITSLLLKDSTWPPYSHDELEALNKVIKVEKTKIYDYLKFSDSFESSDSLNKAKVLDEYLASIRKRSEENKDK